MASDIISRLLGTLKTTFRIDRATIDASGLTSPRSYTLPDASMYLAGLNRTQTFISPQTFLSDGMRLTNAATTGIAKLNIEGTVSAQTLTLAIGAADRTVTITDNVTLPQTIPAAGPTIGQVVALARQIVRY